MEDKGLTRGTRAGLARTIVLAGAIATLCASLALGFGTAGLPPSVGFVDEWGEAGSGPGEFGFPVSVVVHGTGNVYVADSENDRIQRFDTDGGFLGEWGGTGSGPGQFVTPEAVAVDDFGNVYVADKGNHRIQKFTLTGDFVSQWGGHGAGAGQFEELEGLAADHLGNVYVADAGNNRIEKFSPSGTLLTEWGGAGKASGQFNSPSGVAVGKGHVYVADSGNDRIQKFTESGTFVSKWGKVGADAGELDFPTAVATDSAGRVFVADTANDRIVRFRDSGQFLDEWGVSGKASGQFDSPVGLSVAGGGAVFVADAGNNRIQVFANLANPQYGKSVNVGVVSGIVRVHLPGTTKFIVLGTDQQLPVGTIVDAGKGRVRLSSSKGPGGGTQTADFYSGAFRVLQPKGGKPVTVLKLENGLVCPKKGARPGPLARSGNRGLWGSGKGNFRSEGKHGSATVRGTIWWAADTCLGTMFKVKKGVVTIKDFGSGKTLKLRAGQSYLASG